MLILDNCIFLAAPKTGSRWCHIAIQAACPRNTVATFNTSAESYHTGLDGLGASDRENVIAFVRHPLTWYMSYWNHRMRLGWKPEEAEIDLRCGSNTFETFVENVLLWRPGYLSKNICAWVGTKENPVKFIGKYEHLRDDLAWALKTFRVKFNEEVLRNTPRKNVGNYMQHPARYPESLGKAVIEAESEMIERFCYE